MSEDPHADARDRKRHKRRYGPTTTNPGLRIVMRELAQKDRETSEDGEGQPASTKRKRRVTVQRRRKPGR